MRKKQKKSKKHEFGTVVSAEDHDLPEEFQKEHELEMRISSLDIGTKSREIAIKKSAEAERNWNLEKEGMLREIEERGKQFKIINKTQKEKLITEVKLTQILAQKRTDELIRKQLEENPNMEVGFKPIKKVVKKKFVEEINAD